MLNFVKVVAVAFVVIILAAVIAVTVINNTPEPETYTVVYKCEAPFMRQSRDEAVLTRDSDGKLFVRGANGQIEAAAPNTKFKDLCP